MSNLRKGSDPKVAASVVFVHTRPAGSIAWTNERYEFRRVPVVDEFVVLRGTDTETWYRVELVAHTPFADSDFDAEIYCVAEDHHAAMRAVFKGYVTSAPVEK